MRELPTDVQRAIAKQTADMTAEQTAQYADTFFDATGRPTHPTNATVSAVAQEGVPGLIDTEDEDEPPDVNAVGGRSRPQRRVQFSSSFTRPFNPSSSAPRTPNNWRASQPHQPQRPQQSAVRRPAPPAGNPKTMTTVCEYHAAFGPKARQCQPGCGFGKTQLNANAGRRA